MSEVLPPKRQAAVDRLRRRVDVYTKDHQGRYLHYDRIAPALCEQQMQDSFALKQKYLDPKAKKPAKSKNTNTNNTSATSINSINSSVGTASLVPVNATAAADSANSGAERKPCVEPHAVNTQSVSQFQFEFEFRALKQLNTLMRLRRMSITFGLIFFSLVVLRRVAKQN